MWLPTFGKAHYDADRHRRHFETEAYERPMDAKYIVLARAIHVLALVHWIGSVAIVATIVLPTALTLPNAIAVPFPSQCFAAVRLHQTDDPGPDPSHRMDSVIIFGGNNVCANFSGGSPWAIRFKGTHSI